jgi:hypothetical protein
MMKAKVRAARGNRIASIIGLPSNIISDFSQNIFINALSSYHHDDGSGARVDHYYYSTLE